MTHEPTGGVSGVLSQMERSLNDAKKPGPQPTDLGLLERPGRDVQHGKPPGGGNFFRGGPSSSPMVFCFLPLEKPAKRGIPQ